MFGPGRAAGFDKRLQVGILSGYSATFYRESVYPWPYVFDGAAFGGYAEYGLGRAFAIAVDGSVDLHRAYWAYERSITIDEKGNKQEGLSPVDHVTRYLHAAGAVSLLYAIDLFRIVPVFAFGIVATRVDRRVNGAHETERSVGFRIGGGFEYYFQRFSIGGGIYSDRYVAGNDDILNRILISLRGGFVFDFGAESLE